MSKGQYDAISSAVSTDGAWFWSGKWASKSNDFSWEKRDNKDPKSRMRPYKGIHYKTQQTQKEIRRTFESNGSITELSHLILRCSR